MKWIVAIALLMLSCGCLPATSTLVPEIKGRVTTLDRRGVPGATVIVVPADPQQTAPAFEVISKRDGRFYRRAQTRWYLAPFLPAHAMGPELIATARLGNLETQPKLFGHSYTNARFFGLGKVELFDLGDLVLE
jgi:hypothetical protein